MRAVATARATRSPRAVVASRRARARATRDDDDATTTRARFARTALATSALMTMGARAARAASAPDGATARRLRGDVDEATRARTLALAGCVATRDATTR